MPSVDFSVLPLTGWYPGHMLKAGRAMQEVLRLVDLVVELVDARAPASSRNPRFRQLLQSRPVLIVANKADLADPELSRRWQAYLEAQGERVLLLDSPHLTDPSRLVAAWKQVAEAERRGRGAIRELTRPVRLMIAGVPNVGKSTLVNRLYEGKRVLVGPKPGVTRQNQWVPLREGVELLDTPGVLWPKIETKEHELRLGLVGCIRDEVLGIELLTEFLWDVLRRLPTNRVNWPLYGLTGAPATPEGFIEAIARRRGLLLPGGRIDAERAATAVLKDFREGRLGRISIEEPPDQPPAALPPQERTDAP
jgi:ribosome biogenesis GTPase A